MGRRKRKTLAWEIGNVYVERACQVGDYWCGVLELINVIEDRIEYVCWVFEYVDNDSTVYRKLAGDGEMSNVVDSMTTELDEAIKNGLIEFHGGINVGGNQ